MHTSWAGQAVCRRLYDWIERYLYAFYMLQCGRTNDRLCSLFGCWQLAECNAEFVALSLTASLAKDGVTTGLSAWLSATADIAVVTADDDIAKLVSNHVRTNTLLRHCTTKHACRWVLTVRVAVQRSA
jgi:hypothetical protein